MENRESQKDPQETENGSRRNRLRPHHKDWTHRPWKHAPLQPGFRAKRRTLFGRFMGFLFFLALPLVGLGILFGSLINSAGSTPVRFQMVLAFICGLPLVMTVILATIGTLVFRNLGTPLAKIMAAADAVADGDLSARVDESGPGEFRRMARSFNRMTAELERADQQRRNLTADVAHELRTPLHILRGNLEGLQDGVYQPTPEHIEAMLDETQMLARLVDDLQTLSLAEAGQLHLKLEPLDINELLMDVATSFSGQMDAAGIDLQVKPQGTSQDLIISGDVERLDQVFSNLMGNALRHTPKGGSIMLTAESTPKGVRILVRDTGEGIPPEDLPYIFDRFWRGDKSRQRKSGAGSGLGLAIARQFVVAHGGQITVESQPGVGTTFAIDLPKNPALP
jgi:two-component system OmpR family sensor kinase/two-component system sensor histidine kinase BaeS